LTPQREGREENLPGIPEENSLPPGSKKRLSAGGGRGAGPEKRPREQEAGLLLLRFNKTLAFFLLGNVENSGNCRGVMVE
jgi:hypothetical protein